MRGDLLILRAAARAAGDKYFRAPGQCKKGHDAPRLVSTGACVACSRVKYSANTDTYKAKAAAWHAGNRERSREIKTAWRLRNPEKQAAAFQACEARRPDRHRQWKAQNPDRVKANHQRRRAWKCGAEGTHTADDLIAIRSQQRGRCAYCRVKLGRGAHLDHIVPLARGGTNWPRNLQWLCEPCNLSKGGKDPIEFIQARGRLL